jgi:hypothetical protein
MKIREKTMGGSTTIPNRLFSAALVALATAALVGPAIAQVTAAEQSALRASCRSDFMSHCSGVTPGGKDALVCLQKNVASLSADCQKVVKETMPKPAAEKAPTPAPSTTPPPKPAAATAPPPQPTVSKATPPTKPMPAPATAATPAITAPAAPSPEQLKAVKFTCRKDFRRHCKGVPPGGPEALACLERNAARLTQNCKTSIAALTQTAPAAAAPPVPVVPVAKIEAMPLRERLVIFRRCDRDAAAVCPTVKAGEGRLIVCLASHMEALSARCRRTLGRALR